MLCENAIVDCGAVEVTVDCIRQIVGKISHTWSIWIVTIDDACINRSNVFNSWKPFTYALQNVSELRVIFETVLACKLDITVIVC